MMNWLDDAIWGLPSHLEDYGFQTVSSGDSLAFLPARTY